MSKVIIITGAGAGIGKACSNYFLKENYKVALLGRNKNKLNPENAKGKNYLSIECDVSDYLNVQSVFKEIIDKWGRIDVLFNNAGIGNPANTIDLISKENWDSLININLNGSFYCAKEAFHYMKFQNPIGGRIINNGSISAHVPRPGSAPYTVSKHAITGLTKSISLDGRKYNIVCSQIDIGNAGTEMTKKMSKGILQANGDIVKEPVIDVNHIAKAVYDISELPLNTNIQFMTIMASSMPYIGRG
tara:strand:- start:76 stop:813 length:738 start_codon:yes stop_codon:yes gene_type:complete